ncbi:hypothetical protein K0M31_010274 [Melipona bicolor]|uniref:Uncharacterized protein n=1 Tax=Melipona bicolor TaxID=60889 RepID=A0AA40FM81_9HYME|nr:hypothetical protein K0M31_010274 [Melipona bicolor]
MSTVGHFSFKEFEQISFFGICAPILSRVAGETIALPQTSIMMANQLGDELSEWEMLTLACSIIPAALQQLLEITVVEFDRKQSEVGIRWKLVAIVANGILNGFQYLTLTLRLALEY